jgi:hypothetical protein
LRQPATPLLGWARATLATRLFRPRGIYHFSYHKCLTTYYGRIARAIFAPPRSRAERLQARLLALPSGYRHFNSVLPDFYTELHRYRASSVNNQVVDFSRLGHYRATHFIRDPRDLVVSGYFYHRRGAEAWCQVRDPDEHSWKIVNGTIPAELPPGMSYAEYLSSCSLEEGLLAEIAFRQKHFEAMEAWDYATPHCLELRYEDIVGRETAVFARIFDHYALSDAEAARGLRAAELHSAARVSTPRIRDPRPGQWATLFTPRVTEFFQIRHPTLLARLGYA